MSAAFEVKLTASEATLLDGQCRPEVQAVVDRAKDALRLTTAGLAEREAAMVAKIVAVAREKGRVTFSSAPISRCPCCGRSDGYHPHARTGRYHRKGQPNYKTPKLFTGWDLDRGFVTVQHSIYTGFCASCRPRVEPVLLDALSDVRTDTPDHWTGAPHRYRRFDNMHCKSCDWRGHEGQMRPLRTLMGDGTYPGGCPKCPAENTPLGQRRIERAEGFTLVERAAASAPPAPTRATVDPMSFAPDAGDGDETDK